MRGTLLTGQFRENGKFWKDGDYRIVELKCRIFIMRNLKIIISFSRELLAIIQVLRLFCPAVYITWKEKITWILDQSNFTETSSIKIFVKINYLFFSYIIMLHNKLWCLFFDIRHYYLEIIVKGVIVCFVDEFHIDKSKLDQI